jgi:hypothetical protein
MSASEGEEVGESAGGRWDRGGQPDHERRHQPLAVSASATPQAPATARMVVVLQAPW